MRNERDAAVAREQELSDTVWQAKQEEERAARLREDEVIEMEKDIHRKYETQIIGLQQRASEAEEKVRRHPTVPREISTLFGTQSHFYILNLIYIYIFILWERSMLVGVSGDV